MRKVFITGATGVMGQATLKELMAHRDEQQYDIMVLARPSKKNRKMLAPYISKGVQVLWGDLLDETVVKNGVDWADIVLHIGGMVSPLADQFPEKTLKVNIGSAENIVKAAQAKEKDGNDVAVVYIGSVAQYGPHNEPKHWGRCGDRMNVATFDAYALSKVESERIFAESGLKRWVSLRQTGILHLGLLGKASDPISFHVPLKGVLEWVTDEDSGRLMERVCRKDVPEEFWCKFYNIGGGEKYRLNNIEFITLTLSSLGCPPPEKVFDARWFATGNFHGLWYEDSDILENMFHFRSDEGPTEYFDRKKKDLPWYFRLAFLAPGFLIKAMMKRVAYKSPLGTMSWFVNNDEKRIKAHFGSREAFNNLPKWEDLDMSHSSAIAIHRSHGYDETKPIDSLKEEDLGWAAAYREGRYLGKNQWRCKQGHKFKASPYLILKGGHWCPECLMKTYGGTDL